MKHQFVLTATYETFKDHVPIEDLQEYIEQIDTITEKIKFHFYRDRPDAGSIFGKPSLIKPKLEIPKLDIEVEKNKPKTDKPT